MTRRPLPPSRGARVARRATDAGQAAIGLVMLLILMLVTTGAILATNATNHDPLVQIDVVQHYAYRALEAGENSFLNTINAQPNLVNCSTTSKSTTCTNAFNGIKFDSWIEVQGTTAATVVPEYYLWTNPQLCFSTTQTLATACTTKPTSGNLEYVQVLIVGAAGTPGHFQYQRSVANFAPRNGFLTRLVWNNFDATPASLTAGPTTCKYDWANGYRGAGSHCDPGYAYTGATFFGPNTVTNGPVFANDSVYVLGKPTFGTVTGLHPTAVQTADPKCLFISITAGTTSPPSCTSHYSTVVQKWTKTNSHPGAAFERPPSTDAKLLTIAKADGCVYSGPTLISFYATPTNKVGYMNVTSPLTPKGAGTHDNANASTNTNTCFGKVRLPTGTPAGGTSKGNGVIYVQNLTPHTASCSGSYKNPYTAYSGGKVTLTKAQILKATYNPGTAGFDFTYTITASATCAGDVFVRDTNSSTKPSTDVPGIAGNLTVSAQNNIIVTGSLKYADCGTGFNSDFGLRAATTRPCTYHAGSVNDSLGLIANNFVVVNRPGTPRCTKNRFGVSRCTSSPRGIVSSCSSTVKQKTAVLCNAGPTLVIDGAILTLRHSFEVGNWSVGPTTGYLVIYGSIGQYWSGAQGLIVGTRLTAGYTTYYSWDSRLQYVSIPSYLTPGTSSWALVSSSVNLSTTCPAWPKPYPAGFAYLKAGTKTTATVFLTASKRAKSPPTGSSTTC